MFVKFEENNITHHITLYYYVYYNYQQLYEILQSQLLAKFKSSEKKAEKNYNWLLFAKHSCDLNKLFSSLAFHSHLERKCLIISSYFWKSYQRSRFEIETKIGLKRSTRKANQWWRGREWRVYCRAYNSLFHCRSAGFGLGARGSTISLKSN